MPTPAQLNDKYLAKGLGSEDRQPLLDFIKAERDPLRLASLLTMWGYEFTEDPEVVEICLRYIDRPSPMLTATCLKLVCDYWGHWREHEEQLARYLDPDIFEEWYDEVIVAYSYVSSHPYGWSQATLARYARVENAAERLGLSDFD